MFTLMTPLVEISPLLLTFMEIFLNRYLPIYTSELLFTQTKIKESTCRKNIAYVM